MTLNDSFPPSGQLLRTGLCCLVATVLSSAAGRAQVVFSADDLPSDPGAYYRAYRNVAEVDVSTRIGPAGGPHRWDFSEPKAAGETVLRMDVVLPSDGGHGASFPAAAYAERLTRESDGSRSWSYYRIIPALGRTYFGFFDPAGNPANPLTVFNSPTTDLPARVEFTQTWSRTVDWVDVLDLGFFEIQTAIRFSSTAEVDAYGTLALPGLGEVPALRVNEVNTYDFTDLTLGLPMPSQHFRNYYWLVKGIGKAVHIISDGRETMPPPNFNPAKTVLRVFEASDFEDQPLRAVAGLRIRLEDDLIMLDWAPDSSASGYRVETAEDVAATAWRLVAEPSAPSWSEAVVAAEWQKFFRVFAKP
jgi:hypothetical protein